MKKQIVSWINRYAFAYYTGLIILWIVTSFAAGKTERSIAAIKGVLAGILIAVTNIRARREKDAREGRYKVTEISGDKQRRIRSILAEKEDD